MIHYNEVAKSPVFMDDVAFDLERRLYSDPLGRKEIKLIVKRIMHCTTKIN
jgi:hypothetical protein